ncbi:DUF308 domain-containing protein [Corticibacterium sp. UT-5YL-CI-8]|nr:DUF308 domain-containing protein [Tianweitania sp. UT-5YL-CI-8]
MTYVSAALSPRRFAWANTAIGIALILAGIVVLGDVVLAAVVSALVLGIAIICVGFVEICFAVWAGGWRGFLWQTTLGILYIVVGCALVSMPILGLKVLTAVLGVVLIVSGLARVFTGLRNARSGRWLILVSGLFGLLAGVMILIGWPSTGLWAIGAFLGIDLILHGLGWIAASRQLTTAAQSTH